MKLKVGDILITKNGYKFGNGVVFLIREGKHRTVVTVLTDFCSTLTFPSEQDVLEFWDVNGSVNNIRDRLRHQIELLTEALEGLE